MVHWEINRRLVLTTLTAGSVFSAVVAAAYWYQAANLPSVISSKAEKAESEADWEQQITWLNQLLKIQPDASATLAQLAVAADNAADTPPANSPEKVKRARRHLAAAVGNQTFDKTLTDATTGDLRRRLICRDSQLGETYADNVIRQVIALDPPADDALMLKAVALAKNSVTDGTTVKQKPNSTLSAAELAELKQKNFWQWLNSQPLPEILARAWRADPDDIRLADAIFRLAREQKESVKDDLYSAEPKFLDDVSEHLRSLSNNGAAQLTILKYCPPEQKQDAEAYLAEAGLNALNRLIASDADTANLKKRDDRNALPTLETTAEVNSQADFALALSWLQNPPAASGIEREQLEQYLDQLLALKNTKVSPNLRESAFLTRAEIATGGEGLEKAEILRQGIRELEISSLRLQLTLSSLLTSQGDLTEARDSIDKLANTIAKRKRLVGNASSATGDQAWRASENTQLSAAEWHADVLRAELDLRRGKINDALSRLTRASQSQLILAPDAKLRVFLLLAGIYKQKNLWDQTASAYEEAAKCGTEATRYQVLAAEAWEAAGNSTRAFELWKATAPDSIELTFKKLDALVRQQLQMPSDERGFGRLRELALELTAKLDELPESEKQARDRYEARTELLLLRMPDPKDGRTRDSKLERLLKICEKFPTDSEILATTVIALQKAGKTDAAQKKLQELRQQAGEVSPLFITTRARLESLEGQPESAVKGLVLAAEQQPMLAQQLLTLAADLALSKGNSLSAYEALRAIPAPQVTPNLSYQQFALALSDYKANPSSKFNLQQLRNHAENIKVVEGSNGTYYKLAEGEILLAEASQDVSGSEQQRLKLNTAIGLANEITRARPRWGLGLAFRASIAELSRDYATAITLLRNAITNGDKRLASAARLTQLLLKANRFAEAEEVYSQFESIQTIDPKIAALGVYIDSQEGNAEAALELARQNVAAHERDEFAWLLLAQTGIMAARTAFVSGGKESLLQEVKEALDTALAVSNNSSVNVFQLRIRFQLEFFGIKDCRRELTLLANSNASEPARSLLAGLTYLQLRDMEEALRFLTEAAAKAPQTPEVYTALAKYYQTAGNEEKHREMLKQALQLDPQNPELRSRLALALALKEDGAIPWQEIESLLGSQESATIGNPVLHAMLLLNRGSNEQKQKAEGLLNDVIYTSDRNTNDARRLLASYYQQAWEQEKQQEQKDDSTSKWLNRAKEHYRALANSKTPRPMDIYRFADLLLKAGELPGAEDLASQLESISVASPLALEIRLRLANATGQEKNIAELTKLWTEKNATSGTAGSEAVSVAGQVLSRLGFNQEAVFWLGRAYEADDQVFPFYAASLVRTRKTEKVLAVCQNHYSRTNDPNAIAVMADAFVLLGDQRPTPGAEQIFAETLQKHPDSPRLLEAVGTLRLTNKNYEEAVQLYQQALKAAPNSVRILNNLAVAFSETEHRRAEALPVIKRAIVLAGDSPELLDTLGMALYRTDKFAESVEMFRKAVATSNDQRHRFHLLMALLKTGDKAGALANWSRLDIQELKSATLTPSETIALKKIEEQF